MTFELDTKLSKDAEEIIDLPLSKVLFKNERHYAWFLLVPKRRNITEIYQLEKPDQQQLMLEIEQVSKLITDYFKPDKINVAAIGNQVPQLHIHLVGRYKTDPLWPESIWQKHYQVETYSTTDFAKIIAELKELLSNNESH